MAVTNLTKCSLKAFFFSQLQSLSRRLNHEKKSCYLSKFTPSQLLALNGLSIQITYSARYKQIYGDGDVRGRVVAVLVPSKFYAEAGLLFLPDGSTDPDFLDLEVSSLTAIFFP